jgi:hypothetical protein
MKISGEKLSLSVVSIRSKCEGQTKENIHRFTNGSSYINMNSTEEEITFYANTIIQIFSLN